MLVKTSTTLTGVVAVIFMAAVIGATKNHKMASKAKYSTSEIKRGEYLVNAVGGCSDCHTPHIMTSEGPAPDFNRFLAGAPQDEKVPPIPEGVIGPDNWGAMMSVDLTTWSGQWGISFSSNITPDSATGIGSWTEKTFVACLRNGKYWGSGRDLLPPMPWQSFRNMTDNDLNDIYAYLMTLKPVKNVVPAPILPKQ
ncbi:MAG: diheme cytochrome c-553 [Candidatus Kryptoniota bacterium]